VTLDFIRGIQMLIIAFLSYIITITFAGWFESWMAKKVGDDTPEQLGFLTLNPLEHFNVFGFAAVLWSTFYASLLPFQFIPGWGRYIPLLPDTMRGKNLKLRAFIEFMGRSVAHLILLIVFTIIGAMYGFFNLHALNPVMIANNPTSFIQVMFNLFIFIQKQNLVLFVIHFVLGIFKYLLQFYVPKIHEISISRILLAFVVLSLGIYILSPILESFVYLLIGLIQFAILKMRL